MTASSIRSASPRSLMLVLAVLLLGVFLVVASPAQPAHAAGTVTNCVYAGAGGLQAALAGGGTVTFDCDGTIVVPEIAIGINTVLDATGHDVTLSGNNANRVLFVNGGASLTVRHLTVANGNTSSAGGGALVTTGNSLIVENSTFSGNTSTNPGGAIFNDGTLTITGSTITDNHSTANFGGGIVSQSTLDITDSTISLNTAQSDGGGVYILSGTATIQSSTIAGNSADSAGGVINWGTLTVTNSTISGNTASNSDAGGLLAADGTTTVLNSTITGNHSADRGGGVRQQNSAVLSLSNTIVAGNTADTDGPDLSGTITSADYNLIGDPSGATFTPQAHDITGQNPLLGPLADNGGPTQTHALLAGSPAIDAGDTTLTTDQRGVARPQGAADDIGAYEVACPTFPASVGTEGELTIAIGCYNALTSPGTYTFNITQDINLTASTPGINNATSGVALVVEGNGHTIDGQGSSPIRAFDIKANTVVTIQNITVTGFNASGGIGDETGGAIAIAGGTLTVRKSTLSGNQGGLGGAISNAQGTLTVIDSTVSGNRAVGSIVSFGAGIYAIGGPGQPATTFVVNSTLSGNQSAGRGGGIYNAPDSVMTVINSTLSDNTAPDGGGGVVNTTDSTLTLHNTIVANNTSNDCLRADGTVNAENSLIEDGLTCVNGANSNNLTGDPSLGSLANNGGPTQTYALLAGSNAIDAGNNALAVDQNSNPLQTDQRGAGYPRILDGVVDIGAFEAPCSDTSWMVSNETELNAAIGCFNTATTPDTYTIEVTQDIDLTASTTAINNAAAGIDLVIEGAGFTVDGQGTAGVRPLNIAVDTTVTINELTITGGNVTGSEYGGGIENRGNLTLTDSTLANNVSGRDGSAISNYGVLTVTGSTFNGNVAGFTGGTLRNHSSGQLTVSNSTFFGNSGGDHPSDLFDVGTTTLDSVTMASFYGFSDNTTTFRNSILLSCNAFGGAIHDNGHNLVQTPGPCISAFTGPGTILNQDPVLGPLADNGGPTQTRALLAGSPAIDAGDTTLTSDQRGVARPQDAADDIGAFEVMGQPGPDLVVNSSADTDDGACDLLGQGGGNQDCTLREAINAANILGNGTIIFDIPAADGGCTAANRCTIMLAGSLPHVQGTAITIDGAPNNGHITVDGGGSHTVFWSEVANNFHLNAMTVANGWGFLASGGLEISSGDTLVSNSTFVHNESQGGGHIKSITSGTVTIVNSTFFDSPRNGIGNLGGPMLIYNSTIDGNNQPSGTGISADSGPVTLYNTIVVNHGAADCYAASTGTVTADGYNIDTDGTCDSATTKTVAEVNLQPLADNGGHTPTMALGSGSAALDTADDAVCAASPVNGLDQRGVTRPQGPHCDVGAYEAELGTITIVKVTIPGNSTSFDFTDTIEAPNAFSLSNGQQKTFLNVSPRGYTVTEASNTGSFQLRLLNCVDGVSGGTPSTGDVDTRTATINVDPGETVTCTFTNSNQPLGVTLASFDAVAQADHVLVTWETVSELQNSGFNLYRTQTADPPAAANLLAFVPSQGPGSAQGFAYSHDDYDVTAGNAYWYWLEDVDFSGVTTMHGPVSVVFTSPTAVTLSGLEAAAGQPATLVAWPWLLAALAAALAAALTLARQRRSKA